jgi:superoxide dismutase
MAVKPVEVTKDFISLINKLPEVLNKINQDMSTADKRVTEIYHNIEKTEINLTNSIVLMTELKGAIMERRKAKDKHCIARKIKRNWGNLKELTNDILKIVD